MTSAERRYGASNTPYSLGLEGQIDRRPTSIPVPRRISVNAGYQRRLARDSSRHGVRHQRATLTIWPNASPLKSNGIAFSLPPLPSPTIGPTEIPPKTGVENHSIPGCIPLSNRACCNREKRISGGDFFSSSSGFRSADRGLRSRIRFGMARSPSRRRRGHIARKRHIRRGNAAWLVPLADP